MRLLCEYTQSLDLSFPGKIINYNVALQSSPYSNLCDLILVESGGRGKWGKVTGALNGFFRVDENHILPLQVVVCDFY